MRYFPDPFDALWNQEVSSVLGYLHGLGADIGAGSRSPRVSALTVDLSGEALVRAPGDHLPFADNSLDYVYAGHALEHFENPVGAFREWRRVVKPLGHIVLIIPDRLGTPARGSQQFDATHKGEYTWAEMAELLSCVSGVTRVNKDISALILQDGRRWSCKLVYRKHA